MNTCSSGNQAIVSHSVRGGFVWRHFVLFCMAVYVYGAPSGSLHRPFPCSFAVGDYNGDGRSDLVVANLHQRGIGVLLNDGHGALIEQSPIAFEAEPLSLAVGDVNSDGKTDILVGVSGKLLLFLGDGHGNLRPGGEHGAGLYPVSIALGDFNGDGMLDAAVVDAASGSVRLLLGDGEGAFRDGGILAAGRAPATVVAGDFDRDGRLDLAVSNALSHDVTVLLGRGDGTFHEPVRYSVGNTPRALVTGDFNRDGNLDLAVANYVGRSVSVLLGTGAGRFAPAVNYEVGDGPLQVVAGDFDGDGKLDLASANATSGTISILTGNGNGTFQVRRDVPSGKPVSLVAVDLAGNGKSALLAGDVSEGRGALLRGYRDGAMKFGAYLRPAGWPHAAATGTSIASSKNPSILGAQITLTATVTPAAATGTVTFYDGTTMLGAGPVSGGRATLKTIMLPAGTRSLRAYYGGDANYSASTSAVVAQTVTANPGGAFVQPLGSPFGSSSLYNPQAGALGDFNGDGKADFAIADTFNTMRVLLGDGSGGFTLLDSGVGYFAVSLAVADFDGDGNADVVVANGFNYVGMTLFLGNGSGGFAIAAGSPFGRGMYKVVAAGDFNGDGKADLAYIQYTSHISGVVGVLLGDGSGGFADTGHTLMTGGFPSSLVVGDFNGDGKADLAVADVYNLWVFLGDGSGGFTVASGNPSQVGYSKSVAAGDFNGDGILDLAVTNAGDNVIVLLGNGSGGFTEASGSPLAAGSGPRSVAIGDFNGDGISDLAVANEISNDVTVLLGNGRGGFAPASWSPFPVGSDPVSVAVGDFNGDGRADLAVVNSLGKNVTVLLGAPPPTGAARSDFNGDGHPDVVWHEPSTGISQVWFLGGAQGTTLTGAANLAASNTWQIVGVGDFNHDGHPDVVWQDPDTGNATVWFLSGGYGNVIIGTATISSANPWRIVSVADFNGDGQPDIIWQDPSTGVAQIWFMGGAQGSTVTGAANLTASNSWRIVGTGDFNADGHPDVVWQDPVTGAVQVWFLGGAQGNVVTGAANLSFGNTSRVAAIADFNLDGHPDVVWQDPVSGAAQVWFLGGAQGIAVTGASNLALQSTWRIMGPR